jgi:hypothetical protein
MINFHFLLRTREVFDGLIRSRGFSLTPLIGPDGGNCKAVGSAASVLRMQ